MVKKRSINEIIFYSLLIMFFGSFSYAQKDTVYTIDESFESIIKASARDSMFHDYQNKQLHLYGEAQLFYEDISLKADYMLVDFNKNEVFASYGYDRDSNRVGMPKFTDGSEEIEAAKIRYNFDTEKGYIQEVKLKQEENYLYMEVAKRHANEQVHFRKGRFTTCDLEEPHYHFQLSKAILVPDKRIVSGPMNLWIKGVPTPLGLPFAFIPQKKPQEHKHGILFPQYSLQSPYGMGVQNLGYYIPINDSLQTILYANLYARGTWGLSNETSYKIRYKFDGRLNIGYQHIKNAFPDTNSVGKINIAWTHRQDAKANPYWNFSSNVNFISDNNTKTNLDPLNKDYFKNSINSDININRSFPKVPVMSAGMKISMRQNTTSNSFVLTSPVLNFNVTRFSPFAKVRKIKSGESKWYEKIAMTYNLEGQNKAGFQDSLLAQKRFDLIGQSFLNGFTQNSTLQTTISLFRNTWKLNPSISYSNKINFQQIHKSYDAANNSTQIDTLQKVGLSQNVSANVQLTTVLYSYYRFAGKNKTLLRHVLTPSFGLRYTPNTVKVISDSVGVNKAVVSYSAFERSLYAESVIKPSAVLTFGFNNTFELKHKSKKDTVTGMKKTRLIDALTFSGSYDFLKDSMNLSNIAGNLRVNPLEFLNVVASASFSPYDWNDSTNVALKEYAIQNRGKLARFINSSLNTTLILTSEKSRKKLRQNSLDLGKSWTADYQYYALHPEQFIDFEIPWKMTLTHVFDLSRTNTPLVAKRAFNQTQTLALNTDFSFTKRWKMVADVLFDLKTQTVTNTRLSLTRNMHCWNLAFYWTPVGGNKSFLFRLNATSNLFQDAKIELKKPPLFAE